MKILITGQNSYIGTSFETWSKQQNPDWVIDTIDVRGDEWKKTSFSEYDSVFHVAGIAHIKETKKNEQLYYTVNRDLTYELASKSKHDGVKQFIFMSSMSVYGLHCSKQSISSNDIPNPKSAYGKSKLQAEELIRNSADSNFVISIIRPPMVYGEGAPGNLGKLVKLIRIVKIFPSIENKRSAISMNNLCYFVYNLIINGLGGVFLPQDDCYLCTKDIVTEELLKENIKVRMTGVFNHLIIFLIGKNRIISKMFGDLYYEKD